MTVSKHWTCEINLAEHPREGENLTYAGARLRAGDGTWLLGTGRARRNPSDPDVPEIGDEVAVARSLIDLAHQLLEHAGEGIESITGERAHMHA